MCPEDNIYVSTIFICVRNEYPDSIYFVVHVYDFSYLPFDIHVKKYRKNNSHEFGLFTLIKNPIFFSKVFKPSMYKLHNYLNETWFQMGFFYC